MPVIALELNSKGAVTGLKQYESAAKASANATDKLSNKSDKATSSFGKMKSSTGSLLTSLTSLPALIGVVAGALATKLVGGAISAASAMQETQGKFDTVFKGMTEEAEQWSTHLNANFGMSREASKRYLSSVQDLLVPMGMARDSAGLLSNEMVKLSVDLGSFNDMPTAQVMGDIQSALVGEFEPMKKYGVVINAATVKQEAMNLSLADSVEALTAADKAQAAYSLIVKSSKDAVGDFEKTQGSFANQLKIAQAVIIDLKTTLGTFLLPLVTQAITAFNNWSKETNGFQKQMLFVIDSMELFQNGISYMIQGGNWLIKTFATVFDYLVNGFLGLVSPLNLIGEALEYLGIIENPFDMLREAATTFKASSHEVFDEQAADIESNKAAFQAMRDAVNSNVAALTAEKEAVRQTRVGTEAYQNVVDSVKTSINSQNDALEETEVKTSVLTNSLKKQEEELKAVILSTYDTADASNVMDGTYTQLATTLGTTTVSNADSLTKSFNSLTNAANESVSAINDVASASNDLSTAAGGIDSWVDTSWISQTRTSDISSNLNRYNARS